MAPFRPFLVFKRHLERAPFGLVPRRQAVKEARQDNRGGYICIPGRAVTFFFACAPINRALFLPTGRFGVLGGAGEGTLKLTNLLLIIQH